MTPNAFSVTPPAGLAAAKRRVIISPFRPAPEQDWLDLKITPPTGREIRRAMRLHPSYPRPTERSLDATHRLLLVEAWRAQVRHTGDEFCKVGMHAAATPQNEAQNFWRYVEATRETHKARVLDSRRNHGLDTTRHTLNGTPDTEQSDGVPCWDVNT